MLVNILSLQQVYRKFIKTDTRKVSLTIFLNDNKNADVPFPLPRLNVFILYYYFLLLLLV